MLFLIFLIFQVHLGAQEKSGLRVIGVITSETSRTENARASIYEDGKEIQVIGIDANGRFNITFSFNHNYTLVLSDDGLFPKKIEISTSIPNRILKNDPNFPPFVIEQKLFTEIKGIDNSFSENTIIRLFYDPGIDNFISEVFYNDEQIQKQIDNAVWRSQQVGKTAEGLAKLTDAELKLMRQEYDQWLKEAAEDYKNGRYQAALMGYKAANRLFPDEQFPKDRIAEINDLLLALQITNNLEDVQEQKFTELIRNADSEFDLKQYGKAQGLYRQALNIKDGDQHATARIQEIDKILAELTTDNLYASLIEEADRSYVNSNLETAKAKYTEALKIRPKEDYPKNRLKDIEDEEQKLEKDALQLKRYELAMEEADQFRDKKQYLRARETYVWAMSFKPGDENAQQRIKEVDELIKNEGLDKDYNKLISDADKSFKKEDYQNALQTYNNAITLKPDEEYPQSQVNLINNILKNKEALNAANQQYLSKIAEADKLFHTEKYIGARPLYAEALLIKPDEKYPLEKINEIDQLLENIANLEKLNSDYNELIKSADKFFNNSEYQPARSGYSTALELKPDEIYPAGKIREIDRILQDMAEKVESYNKAIAEADKLFEKPSLIDARAKYSDAAEIKPDETYPVDQIARIDALMKEQERVAAEKESAEQVRLAQIQNETNDKYNAIIDEAYKAFKNGLFEEARNQYENALKIKSEEIYPVQQIARINDTIVKLEQQNKEYEKLVATADRQFDKKQFEEAQISFESASSVKPDEVYPGLMIAKIDSIIQEQQQAEADRLALLKAEQDKLESEYNQTILQADNNLKSENFQEAIESYKSALELKPNENYPIQKIEECEAKIAEIQTNEKAYNEAISSADKAFKKENYAEAKVDYNKALQFFPNKTYPQVQLKKIVDAEQLLAQESLKDKNYRDAINKGDSAFVKREYNKAILSYEQALTYKPEEKYPQDQINLSKRNLEEFQRMKKVNEEYDKAIADANEAFNNADFETAEKLYNNAMKIKPNEKYPRERLNAIVNSKKDILIKERYDALIAEADLLFDSEDYNKSRNKYLEALKVIEGDEYAQGRIDEIDAILAALAKAEQERKELERKYSQAIAFADKEFGEGGYSNALKYYNEALNLKPEETYPSQQVEKINIILENNRIEEEYKRLLLAADAYFRMKEYPDARFNYVDALKVKPEEEYPARQIERIDEILKQQEDARIETERLAQMAAEEETAVVVNDIPSENTDAIIEAEMADMYNGFIIQADGAFGEEEYNIARFYYFKAVDIRPDEEYPKNRIKEIRGLLNARLSDRREREYQDYVDKADQALTDGELAVARGYYNRALTAKPMEKYPKMQIDLIQTKLQEMLGNKSQTEYNSFISQGDKAFENKNYSLARYYYLKAQEINPAENYPKEQILKITKAINGELED
ncbi:MAG: hypothetical protein JXR31_06100 [Prolixibacteraceae bacterium]|nr:hypothetical protein [Prolixibacteraceae bacterium]MBN2773801.1 hypothetical protein [Prolixibacteraceae bacterium]